MEKGRNADLTQGPIAKQLIRFALPLLAGSLIQQLYSTVDMMFVGRVLGSEAAAAVGSSGMIVTCIIGFFTGLSVGISVAVGKAFGGNDSEKLNRYIHTAAALTLLMAAVFTVLGLLLAPTLLRWMDVPAKILSQATAYIRLYLLGLVSVVSYNVGTGILKALGNSTAPMLYQLIGGLANVLGNAVFICVLDWGIVGAALATVCTQSLAAALTICHLFRLPQSIRLKIERIRLDWKTILEILAVGIPAAVQAIVVSLSNAIVQSHINRLGVAEIAAFTAYYKVENILYYPIMAIGQSCSAFVSQSIGAGKLSRAKQGTRTSLLLGTGVTATLTTMTLAGVRVLFGFFSTDQQVIELGVKIAWVAYPFYFLYVFLEVYAASVRGAGKAMPGMAITVVNMCFVRICILKLVLRFAPSITGVAAVYPLTWASTAACMYLYYRSGRWQPQQLKSEVL